MYRLTFLICLLMGINFHSSAQSLFHAASTVSFAPISTTPKVSFETDTYDFWRGS